MIFGEGENALPVFCVWARPKRRLVRCAPGLSPPGPLSRGAKEGVTRLLLCEHSLRLVLLVGGEAGFLKGV